MIAERHETLTMRDEWSATTEEEGPDALALDAAVIGQPIARGVASGWLELVFLLGLGSVFLANAAVAMVEPASFQELVAASPIGGLIGGAAWIAPLIAVNDLLIGAAVIASYRLQALRAPVLAWAGLWLLMVTVMKATTMG